MIKEQRRIEEYYNALLNRDSQYQGVFFVGVKTTGVFCISTCSARKPKLKNVEFYRSAKEALQYGFRPCKVCKPTENTEEPPEEIKHLIRLVSENPEKKIKDYNMRELGYSPEKVRRWFKNHHGITFQAYQRMIRINLAYEYLKQGKNVTSTAFDSGYDSLSGFGYSFKNILEKSPDKAESINIIHLHRFSTVLGPMYSGASKNGLCLLEFTDRRMLETEFEELSRKLKAKITVGVNEHVLQTEKEITEYFAGKRKVFDVSIDAPGSDFQHAVWNGLQQIPYGTTRSYKQQALVLGKPNSVRAVANANGQNRIAIIIPCHRVIGSDGSLTGYAGGLPRKKWLLEHEQKH